MLTTVFCLAALAQAQPSWQEAKGPLGEQAVLVGESYGKRVLLSKPECPPYLAMADARSKQPFEWRLVRDTDGKASWRRWGGGYEDVVYPRELAGAIFPNQKALNLFAGSRADLKPPVDDEKDIVFAAYTGISKPGMNADQGKTFASTVGLEPDDPPAQAIEIPPEVVAVGCLAAGVVVIAIGTFACLRSSKENQ